MSIGKLALAVLAIVGLSFIFSSHMVAAWDPFGAACSGGGGSSAACQANGSTSNLTGTGGTLTNVASILTFVAGIISIIFVIIGGVKYVLSGGDSAQISSAKNTIIYALVGLVVALIARGIIQFVINKV